MPKQIKAVRFCLGAAKINAAENIETDEQGAIIVRGGENIGEQQLLCGGIIELK